MCRRQCGLLRGLNLRPWLGQSLFRHEMKWDKVEKQSDARINNTQVQMCAAVTVPFLTGKSAKVISTRIMIMPQEQVEGIREYLLSHSTNPRTHWRVVPLQDGVDRTQITKKKHPVWTAEINRNWHTLRSSGRVKMSGPQKIDSAAAE